MSAQSTFERDIQKEIVMYLKLIAASLALAFLAGCNTMAGAGKDIEKGGEAIQNSANKNKTCLLYTSPSPRDRQKTRMPSSA